MNSSGTNARLDPTLPQPHSAARGIVLIEFALILPLLLLLVLALVDFGHLVQTRLIITNVSREGGSIASRDLTLDPALADLLVVSGRPLNLAGGDAKVYITRIVAGQDDTSPDPTVTEQISRGSLGVGSKHDAGSAGLGLSGTLYNHLVFREANGTADIKEVTAVEVYYKYRPITPLANFIPGMLRDDGDGMIIGSRAVF